MTKPFKPNDRIRITHLILTEQPQDALSRTFTIAETYPLTNCVKVVEDIGCIFHMSQIELVEPSFKFTLEDECVPGRIYTAYHPYDGTDNVLVTWPDENNYSMVYGSSEVDKFIERGSWKVVPKLPDYFEITTHGGTYSMTRNNGGATYICHGLPRSEKDAGGVWDEESIQKYLDDGTWKLVEAEKGLPDSFTFHTRFGDLLCTATRILNNNYEVRWGEGIRESQLILQESVIKERLANRDYTLAEPIPEVSTIEQEFGTAAFLEIEPTHEEASEICVPTEYVNGFLDLHAVKRFTVDYPASIFFDSGKYVMYFEDDALYADTDTDLFELMQAIRVMSAARGK